MHILMHTFAARRKECDDGGCFMCIAKRAMRGKCHALAIHIEYISANEKRNEMEQTKLMKIDNATDFPSHGRGRVRSKLSGIGDTISIFSFSLPHTHNHPLPPPPSLSLSLSLLLFFLCALVFRSMVI